jgi:hypothetical protein
MKYQQLKDAGLSPDQIDQTARSDGLDWAARIRLIRELFGYSLVEAKEITVRTDGLANSLSEYQESFADVLEQFFREDDQL